MRLRTIARHFAFRIHWELAAGRGHDQCRGSAGEWILAGADTFGFRPCGAFYQRLSRLT
jgi:hypothetical protein